MSNKEVYQLNIEKINENIEKKFTTNFYEMVEKSADYNNFKSNNKLAINFKTCEIWIINNMYLNSDDKDIDNIGYFELPIKCEGKEILHNYKSNLTINIIDSYVCKKYLENNLISFRNLSKEDIDVKFKFLDKLDDIGVLDKLALYEEEGIFLQHILDILDELSKITDDINRLKILAKNKYSLIRENVALNKNTPSYILEELYEDEESCVRCNVASNKNTPSYILDELAYDEEWIVRQYVAGNINTSIEILEKLAEDEDEDVRMYVAYNKNTSNEAFKILSEDKNEFVLCEVAKNVNCPINILVKLVNKRDDKYSEIALNTLINKNNYELSRKVLEKLLNNEDNFIVEKTLKKLESYKDDYK